MDLSLSLITLIMGEDIVLDQSQYRVLRSFVMLSKEIPTFDELMDEYNKIKETNQRMQYVGYCILARWFLFFKSRSDDRRVKMAEAFRDLNYLHRISEFSLGSDNAIIYNLYKNDYSDRPIDRPYKDSIRILLLHIDYFRQKTGIYIKKSEPYNGTPHLPPYFYSQTLPGATDSGGGGKRSVPKRTNQKFSYKNKEYVIYEGSRAGKYIRINKKFISIRSL